ncbi:MAG: plasmid partitioning protein RepB [Pseudomonadota bacterium]
MARKNLLKGLMEAQASPAQAIDTKAAQPRPKVPKGPGQASVKGAIGAVSQTIADLKSRAVIDLDPDLIRAGGLSDRLEDDAAEDAKLRQSIATHGQQVPVLVRPHPDDPDLYQIVYGRRRARAARDLGRPVKAMVRALDDEALILAQGQENSGRRDLSFIERAHFARQMVEAGFARPLVAEALTSDKAEVSRLLSVSERIPPAILQAIGSAPGIGRARWLKLADLIEATQTTETEGVVLAHGTTSDARFDALVQALTLPQRRAQSAAKARARDAITKPLSSADGAKLGQARITPDKTVLTLPAGSRPGATDGFADWLIANMADLHRRWQSGG